jgi:hypothetical protein
LTPTSTTRRIPCAGGPERATRLYRGFKLVLRQGVAPALYNLAQDPGEHRNLAREDSQTLAALTGLLDHELDRSQVPSAAALPESETARQLHALGYL